MRQKVETINTIHELASIYTMEFVDHPGNNTHVARLVMRQLDPNFTDSTPDQYFDWLYILRSILPSLDTKIPSAVVITNAIRKLLAKKMGDDLMNRYKMNYVCPHKIALCLAECAGANLEDTFRLMYRYDMPDACLPSSSFDAIKKDTGMVQSIITEFYQPRLTKNFFVHPDGNDLPIHPVSEIHSMDMDISWYNNSFLEWMVESFFSSPSLFNTTTHKFTLKGAKLLMNSIPDKLFFLHQAERWIETLPTVFKTKSPYYKVSYEIFDESAGLARKKLLEQMVVFCKNAISMYYQQEFVKIGGEIFRPVAVEFANALGKIPIDLNVNYTLSQMGRLGLPTLDRLPPISFDRDCTVDKFLKEYYMPTYSKSWVFQ